MLVAQSGSVLNKLTAGEITFLLALGIFGTVYVLVAFADALRALAGHRAGNRMYHVPVVPAEKGETEGKE